MKTAHQLLDELLEIIGPLVVFSGDPQLPLAAITAKLEELRSLKVDEDLIVSVAEGARVFLGLDPGDDAAAISHAICDIEEWKEENEFFMGHLEED